MYQITRIFLVMTTAISVMLLISCNRSKKTVNEANDLVKKGDSLYAATYDKNTGKISIQLLKEASINYKDALEIYDGILDKNDSKIARCLAHLYIVSMLLEDENTNDIKNRLNNFYSELETHFNKAKAFEKNNQFTEAEVEYKKALAILEEISSGKEVINYLLNFAKFYSDQKIYNDSERLRKHVLEIDTVTPGTNYIDIGLNLQNLAMDCLSQEHYPDAIKYANEALRVFKSKNDESGILYVAVGFETLGDIYSQMKNYIEAELNYKEAIQIFESHGKPTEHFATLLEKYSKLLNIVGKKSLSNVVHLKSLKILESISLK